MARRKRRAWAEAAIIAGLVLWGWGCSGDETTSAPGPVPGTVGTVVTTEQGEVAGEAADDLRIFRGIPYAAPPVGDRRLRPPAAPEPFDGTLDATEFGPACPQLDRPNGWAGPAGSSVLGEEDCLTLNVWTHAEGGPRPVMVFVHGGGFVAGASSLALFEASSLARGGDVVVVTLNYRLGALGFLATEALAAESGEDSAGNYGLRDQIAALEWVARNMAGFGGDPTRVTLFGESAGGFSICALLGAPTTEGLFAQAIIESGGGCYGYPRLRTGTVTALSGIDKGGQVLDEVGCAGAADEVACLRALPVGTMAGAGQAGLDPTSGMAFWPLIDGALVTAEGYDALESGARDLPLVIGSNADEMSLFTVGLSIQTEADYAQVVGQLIPLPALAAQVLALYPASAFDSPKAAYDALAFVCPALAMAQAAAGGAERAWAYHFIHTVQGPAAALGAFHSLELAFVFGNPEGLGIVPTADDLALIDPMQRAWSSFAREQAPATDPTWTATGPSAPSIELLDVPMSSVTEIRDGRCAGLKNLGLVR
jgi:para-nitrobenzyl esterase